MSITIAMDIGGTHMRAAVFHENENQPREIKRIRTYVDGKTSVDRLINLIEDVTPQGETIQAIGIAVPGPMDPKKGVILAAPNLKEWTGIPLQATIETHFGVRTRLGNDANMAAVGEWRYGAGQGHHHVLYLTISTGVGGGVICHDQLLLGEQGIGAELGHVTILPDGPMCSCGQRGHIEAISSGTGIANYVAEQLQAGRVSSLTGKPDAKAISLAAKQGDALALEAFNRAGYYLGLGIANYLMIFNPSIVILGGGVSETGDLIMNPIRKTVEESVLSKHFLQNLTITRAALGDNAGLYGALALARDSVTFA